jgi:hypothetical protein
MVAMTRSGVTTADDLFKKKLTIGATGFSNENRMLPALLNEHLGTKMNIVPGLHGPGRGLPGDAARRSRWLGLDPRWLKEGEPAKMLADGKMKVLLHWAGRAPRSFRMCPT